MGSAGTAASLGPLQPFGRYKQTRKSRLSHAYSHSAFLQSTAAVKVTPKSCLRGFPACNRDHCSTTKKEKLTKTGKTRQPNVRSIAKHDWPNQATRQASRVPNGTTESKQPHTLTHTCSETSYRITDVECIARAKTLQLNLTGMVWWLEVRNCARKSFYVLARRIYLFWCSSVRLRKPYSSLKTVGNTTCRFLA